MMNSKYFLLFFVVLSSSGAQLLQYDSDDNQLEGTGLFIPEDAVGRRETPQRNKLLLKSKKPLSVNDILENRCYCSYGHEEGICDRNMTCIKHDLAACFHAVEEVYNKVDHRMETWHKYGCAPLERGSDASHLTCNGWRASHFRPKSIACCYEGNYCNRDLEPPPYANLKEHDWDSLDSHFMKSSSGLRVFIITSVVAALLILSCVIAICWRRRARKSKDEEGLSSEKELMIYEDSGSGSGLTTLNQRTVAQDLTIIKVVGRGRYGEVRKALYRGSYVAVKTFYTTEEESWKNERDVYQTQMLNHRNILQFVAADICSEDSITQMLLITDYHELGSLCDYLRRENESLSILEAIQLAHSSICGIEHLHTARHGTGSRKKPEIAHRDIKSKNILVKRAGVCCIADFGMAVRLEDKMIPERVNIQVGTKRYMAPEVLSKTLNTANFQQFKMADMYSFALVMWEIARRVECTSRSSEFPGHGDTSDSSGLGESLSSSTDKYEPKVHMQKSSVDMSTRARPYVPPFEGMVENDPSFDEMRVIVCVENKRPPIEKEWEDPNNIALHRMTSLMVDCWHTHPDCRHTALKVKKELLKILELMSSTEMQSLPLSPDSLRTAVTTGEGEHRNQTENEFV